MKKKIMAILLAGVLAAGSLAGCGSSNDPQAEKAQASQEQSVEAAEDSQGAAQERTEAVMTIKDQIGREVTLKAPAKRIVSSYYITTAIAVALGLQDQLRGIEMKADTRELYKRAAPQLLELPAVGSGKGINVEETANLNPDVVILPLKLKDSVEQFEKLGIPVLVVNPETLTNYMNCVTLIGTVAGVPERAGALNQYYQEKMDEVKALTGELKDRPKVYLAAGSGYLSTCTSKMYQNDLIEMAGGTNVSGGLEDGYWAKVSPEQLLDWNPDYIFAVSYAEYTLEDVTSDRRLSEVRAVKDKNVKRFPSGIEPWDYPAPSSVLGILWLTHVLHPDLYSQEAYVQEAKDFYQEFFDIQVEESDLGL